MKKYFVFAAIAVLPSLGAVDENSPMLKEFLQTAATFPADNPAELVQTPMLKWESHREYRIIFANAEYYSFKAVESSYTGGGHGMSKTTVGTFRNGRRLKLADLGDQRELTEKWQQAIARHFKAASFAEYVRRKDGIRF